MSSNVLVISQRVGAWSDTPARRARLKRLLWFAIAGVLILLGRVPSIIAPPADIDEGLYATAGQAITRGDLLYRDLWDNKPPAIYFLYSWISRLNPDYTAFRLVATVFLIATAGVIYLIAYKSLKSQTRWALVVFSFLAIVPVLETHTSNAEVFFLLPTSLAILITLLIEWHNWSKRHYVLVGACLALALLFKVVVLFDALAIVSLLVFRHGRSIRTELLGIVLGALPVLGVPLAYLVANGLFTEFVRAAFVDNLDYVGQGNVVAYPGLAIAIKLLLLAAGLILIYRSGRHAYEPVTLIYLWFLWTMFGAVLSGRPYLHYLIAAMGALSLLIPVAWQAIWPPYKWRSFGWVGWARAVAFAAIFAGVMVFGFGRIAQFVSTTPEMSRVVRGYYGNAQKYLSGQITRDQYLDFYGETLTLNLKTAEYLRQNSAAGAHVFIWGNAPWVYYLSERQPGTRYLVAYQATFVKDAPAQIMGELASAPPEYIVMTNEPAMFAEAGAPTPPFPQLDEFVREQYRLTTRIGRIEIYGRKSLTHLIGATWKTP